jgi:hypothetical protein
MFSLLSWKSVPAFYVFPAGMFVLHTATESKLRGGPQGPPHFTLELLNKDHPSLERIVFPVL